jgi:uncharacterized protein (DUF169 family)
VIPQEIAQALTAALKLRHPPVAIALVDAPPAGVPVFAGRVPAGCRFWQEAGARTFVTAPKDHDLCAIGTFTHNLAVAPAHEVDRGDALEVFADLGYVRPEDIPLIPVLARRPAYVVYGPLAEAPVAPDVVLLFVRADQTLILSEASQSFEGGLPPAMGRPACAVVAQAKNSGRSALSLGCCGARAYLDVLTDDMALYAVPGERIEAFARRVAELAKANEILTVFHRIRRRDVEAGGAPTIKESLAAMARAPGA